MSIDKNNLPTPCDDATIAPGDIVGIDRDAKGHFIKGNTISKLSGKEFDKLRQLRKLWWDCCTPAKMQAVHEELFKLALECNDPKIRLAACLHIEDRTLGKVTQTVDLNVDTGAVRQRPIDVELSVDEQALLERIVSRQYQAAQVIEVQALPSPKV